jgi:hypothetical protein
MPIRANDNASWGKSASTDPPPTVKTKEKDQKEIRKQERGTVEGDDELQTKDKGKQKEQIKEDEPTMSQPQFFSSELTGRLAEVASLFDQLDTYDHLPRAKTGDGKEIWMWRCHEVSYLRLPTSLMHPHINKANMSVQKCNEEVPILDANDAWNKSFPEICGNEYCTHVRCILCWDLDEKSRPLRSCGEGRPNSECVQS